MFLTWPRAELSEDYHERTRLFGVEHIGFTLGSILSLVSMSLLIAEETNPEGNVRELAGELGLFAVAAMSLMIFFSVSRLKENPDFQNRVNKNPFKAFKDVWINPHARILIIVLFIENWSCHRCFNALRHSICCRGSRMGTPHYSGLYASICAFSAFVDSAF